MRFALAAFIFAFSMTPSFAVETAGDPEMIVLTMTVYSNGDVISKPEIAFDAGKDASIMVQGIDVPGTGERLTLELAFHPVHVHETGAEILLDFDSGPSGEEHVEARLVAMTWNEPHELVFPASADTPGLRIVIAPSRATRSEFLAERRNSN